MRNKLSDGVPELDTCFINYVIMITISGHIESRQMQYTSVFMTGKDGYSQKHHKHCKSRSAFSFENQLKLSINISPITQRLLFSVT